MWFGAERPKWLGPVDHDYPNHLRGEAPADYGFDVLSLGSEPDAFARNFELELLHSRWAMLGAFGALLPGPACSRCVATFANACQVAPTCLVSIHIII